MPLPDAAADDAPAEDAHTDDAHTNNAPADEADASRRRPPLHHQVTLPTLEWRVLLDWRRILEHSTLH